MSQAQLKQWVFAALAMLVLIAFIWLFATELWPVFAKGVAAPGPGDGADPRTYIMTGIATLVGGVAAVFLGVKGQNAQLSLLASPPADYIRVAYVIVYSILGVLAVIAWMKLGTATSLPLKNLAVTFFGLLGPAVSAFLNTP